MTRRLDDGQIKTPGERMAMVLESWRFVRAWVRGAVQSQHPDWGPSRVDAEVSGRMSRGAD